MPPGLPRPDLRPYERGSDGIPYVHSFTGPLPGPHAMIAALVHGNELCGAIAVDRLLRGRLRPACGRLTLAFVNVAACQTEPPARFLDEDLNRVWAPEILDGPRQSRELARARALRPMLDRVDFLLDLHSMQSQVEPLALAGVSDKGAALARAIGVPRDIVHDPGHPAGPRMRDYGAFADPSAANAAVLIECGQHQAAGSAALAWEAALRFLVALEMLPSPAARGLEPGLDLTGPEMPGMPGAGTAPSSGPFGAVHRQRRIRVTGLVTAGDSFRLAGPWAGMEILPRRGTLVAWNDGVGVTTPYDDCVLVMPTPAAAAGTTALRFGKLVEDGG